MAQLLLSREVAQRNEMPRRWSEGSSEYRLTVLGGRLNIAGVCANCAKLSDMCANCAKLSDMCANRAKLSDMCANCAKLSDMCANCAKLSDMCANCAKLSDMCANCAKLSDMCAKSFSSPVFRGRRNPGLTSWARRELLKDLMVNVLAWNFRQKVVAYSICNLVFGKLNVKTCFVCIGNPINCS